jgi:hypothetical protein
VAIGGASPPSRWTHRMKGIRSLLPHQASSRWFTCSAGPSGVVPGAGAAAESGAPLSSSWRMMKDLIAF